MPGDCAGGGDCVEWCLGGGGEGGGLGGGGPRGGRV